MRQLRIESVKEKNKCIIRKGCIYHPKQPPELPNQKCTNWHLRVIQLQYTIQKQPETGKALLIQPVALIIKN